MKKELPIDKLTSLREWVVKHCENGRFGFDPTTLECGCGTVAYLSFLMLKEQGFPVIFRENPSHAFVTVDGTIIDLTAQQFSRKFDAVLIKKSRGRRHYFHEHRRSGNTLTKIRTIFKKWPSDQTPFGCLKRLKKNDRAELEEIIGTKLVI
jgi:hypothetical protein